MIWIYFILITTSVVSARDTIFSNQTLKDGEFLVSAGGVFEFGFFRFENPIFRYVGIRYKSIPTADVVWVANGDAPLFDDKGMLKLNGTLQLLNASNNLIWSAEPVANTSNQQLVALQLLDTGNLVLKEEDDGKRVIWQSFDHPGNTWLPGMKIGVHYRPKATNVFRPTGLTSWKTSDDPSTGSYTLWMGRVNISGHPELYILQDESSILQKIGFWNGLVFTGMSRPKPSNFCSSYGSCNINRETQCRCLEGFEPNLKLPARTAFFNLTMSLEECKNFCNVTDYCTAYANADIRDGGSGCIAWSKELIDIREAAPGDYSGAQDIT